MILNITFEELHYVTPLPQRGKFYILIIHLNFDLIQRIYQCIQLPLEDLHPLPYEICSINELPRVPRLQDLRSTLSIQSTLTLAYASTVSAIGDHLKQNLRGSLPFKRGSSIQYLTSKAFLKESMLSCNPWRCSPGLTGPCCKKPSHLLTVGLENGWLSQLWWPGTGNPIGLWVALADFGRA